MKNKKDIPNQFNLPENYFSTSKANILDKIEWLKEHEAYPVLSKVNKTNSFCVPQNYFNNNASHLELLHFSNLKSIPKQNPFHTPPAYFAEFKASFQNKLEHHDELGEFVHLSKLKNEYPLAVNPVYFTESKKQIQKIYGSSGGAKIIALNPKKLWYAAAAALTLTVGLWVYNSFFNVHEAINGDCNTLACIEKRELLKYKLDNLDNDELYEMVNSEKLLKNLTQKENADSLSKNDSLTESLMDYIE